VLPISEHVSRHEAGLPNAAPWNTLPEHDAAEPQGALTPVHLRRGERVDGAVGIVSSGALAVERRLYDGRRVLSALFHGSDLVDLTRSARKHQDQLTALNPSLFLRLDDNQMHIIMGRRRALAEAMLANIRKHSERMRSHVTDLVHKTPIERLAALMFEFKRWPDNERSRTRADIIRLPIQRADIADYIGVKPETVSRATTKLVREGLISIIGPDEIQMLDIPAMRRIADGGRPRQSTRAA